MMPVTTPLEIFTQSVIASLLFAFGCSVVCGIHALIAGSLHLIAWALSDQLQMSLLLVQAQTLAYIYVYTSWYKFMYGHFVKQ